MRFQENTNKNSLLLNRKRVFKVTFQGMWFVDISKYFVFSLLLAIIIFKLLLKMLCISLKFVKMLKKMCIYGKNNPKLEYLSKAQYWCSNVYPFICIYAVYVLYICIDSFGVKLYVTGLYSSPVLPCLPYLSRYIARYVASYMAG